MESTKIDPHYFNSTNLHSCSYISFLEWCLNTTGTIRKPSDRKSQQNKGMCFPKNRFLVFFLFLFESLNSIGKRSQRPTAVSLLIDEEEKRLSFHLSFSLLLVSVSPFIAFTFYALRCVNRWEYREWCGKNISHVNFLGKGLFWWTILLYELLGFAQLIT